MKIVLLTVSCMVSPHSDIILITSLESSVDASVASATCTNIYEILIVYKFKFMGGMSGSVANALASYRYGPGSNPSSTESRLILSEIFLATYAGFSPSVKINR